MDKCLVYKKKKNWKEIVFTYKVGSRIWFIKIICYVEQLSSFLYPHSQNYKTSSAGYKVICFMTIYF